MVLTHAPAPDLLWLTPSRPRPARSQIEKAHLLGVTSVSWSPPTPPGSLVTAGSGAQLVKCFVSGGCDNTVKARATAPKSAPGGILRTG